MKQLKLVYPKKIIGLKITAIEIRNQKTFQGDPKVVTNQKIISVWRRAKALGIDFENGYSLLFHLKMSGQVIFKGKGNRFVGGHPTHDMLGELPNKSTRVIFTLDSNGTDRFPAKAGIHANNSSYLFFNDQRKFGWIKVVNREQLLADTFLGKLGPEPFDQTFDWQTLKQNLMRHKSQPVKVAILDQSIVSGVGNIYACEACFNSKIDPRTKVGTLTDKQFTALFKGILLALGDGIKYGGSTKTHFVDSDGKKGVFLDHAKVYAREKKPCLVCGTEIKKIKLGGRGTFFCPHCQK